MNKILRHLFHAALLAGLISSSMAMATIVLVNDAATVAGIVAEVRHEIHKSIVDRNRKSKSEQSESEIQFEIEAELLKFQIVTAAEEPELIRQFPGILAILEKLDRLDPDPSVPTLVAILDDLRENASFLKLKDGRKLIFINKGLFFGTENDHQFAFVGSHEMEHGHSRLQSSAKALFGEKAAPFYKRSEENEIDLRAVYHRMIGAGFNPYAAEDSLQGMIDRYGDDVSDTHTSSASRRDALSTLITSLRRQGGKGITRPTKFEDAAVKPIQAYLFTKSHRERQRRLMLAYIDSFESHPELRYEALKNGEHFPEQHSLEQVFKRAKENIVRIGDTVFSDTELDEFFARLYFRVDKQYEAARIAFDATDVAVTGTGWVQQYRSLLWRKNESTLPSLLAVLKDIKTQAQKIKDLEAKLSTASGDAREKLDSELLQLRAKMARLLQKKAWALLAYEPIPESALQKLEPSLGSGYSEDEKTFNELILPYRKYGLGELIANRNRELLQMSDEHRAVFVDSIARDTSVGADRSLHELFGLDPDLRREIQLESYKYYLEFRQKVSEQYAQEGRLKDVEEYFFRQDWITFPHDTIKVAVQHDPKKALQLWWAHIDALLALDFSDKTKMLILKDMVFSENLNNSFPAEELAKMREHFSEIRKRLRAATFLKDLEKKSPNEMGTFLRYFVEQEKFVPIPGWFIKACVEIFEKRLRSDGALIQGYDRLFVLRNPGLWQKIEPGARPSLPELWAHFLSIPKHRTSGRDWIYQMDFDYMYELFVSHIGEIDLFRKMIEMRHHLEFSNSPTEAQSQVRSKFFDFVRRHRPQDAEFFTKIVIPHTKERELLLAKREKLIIEAMSAALKASRKEPLRERTYLVARKLAAQFSEPWGESEVIQILRSLHPKWMPKDRGQRLEMSLVMMEMSYKILNSGRVPSDATSPESLFPKDSDLEQVPLELLIEYWRTIAHPSSVSDQHDRLFNYIWKNVGIYPALLAQFTFPELVPTIKYDDEKEKLAVWQINWFLNQPHPGPQKHGIRPIVLKTAEFIKTQFPAAGGLRNRILDLAENKLIANSEETLHFKTLRQTPDDPKASPTLLLVDSVHHLAKLAKSNVDKQEMIEFLAGKNRPRPNYLTEDQGKSLKRIFLNSGESVRAFAFQGLLDVKTGVLSEPAVKARLDRFLLGDNVNTKVLRALFDSYLDSVEPSERVVLISYALASMASGGGEQISVRTMLELMGPLGIKAGQFLKTTGLVGPEIRKELDGFLDRALAPVRYQIFDRLRAVFGDDLEDIELVEELIGSGSINYVVKAKVRGRSIAIRLLREESLGQVTNEDKIWRKVIGSMRSSPDAELKTWGGILDEARSHSMRTLAKGGAEFDLQLERQNYQTAAKVYSSVADPTSGYSVKALRPDFSLQNLVPKKFKKSVTIMELVDATALPQIEPRLRQHLAEQIVAAELRAIFEIGTFDPDGHPGNWLVDVQNRQLVRIDYAQMYKIKSEKRELLRSVLKLMVQPNFSTADIASLAQILPKVFAVTGATQDWTTLLSQILRTKKFPSYHQPQERLIHLREALEQRLGADSTVRFDTDLRTVVSALSRIAGFRTFMQKPAKFDHLLLAALGTSRIDIAVGTVGKGLANLRNECEKRLKAAP